MRVVEPLRRMFSDTDYPNLLMGLDAPDDAAVYQFSDELALIITLDFFTPIVDDPYTFGAIAAANAMSDVYAMGGEVLLALNICAFPSDLSEGIVSEILRGGAEKVKEAGGVIAGGHTVDDQEPKYGLAVVGTAHPKQIIGKAGARPGDRLVLTKPLGVGLITTAHKADVAKPEHVDAAVNIMLQLNRDASRAMSSAGVHAATDITGYALIGHAWEIAEQSGVGMRFHLSTLPFIEGALEYAEQFLFPAGTCWNEQCYGKHVRFAEGISDELRMLLFTPETSGGLLIAVPPTDLQALCDALRMANQQYWVIGEVIEGEAIEIVE